MDGDHAALTSYCGLYCGDCVFGRGTVPDLARDLRKELREARFDKVAEVIPFMDLEAYQNAYEFMGQLVKMRCKGCRGGSRSKFCHIAQCVQKNELEGCWECGEFASCEKLEFLVPVHGDGHLKNLRKIRKEGIDAWAGGKRWWYSPVKK
jgi:hypothetical protein